MDVAVASLVLPHIDAELKWVMFAARTSKALAAHLDMNCHWDDQYRSLLAELNSGRARFEITRYVSCCRRDSFYWDYDLRDFFFTVCVLQPSTKSFARQAVPQMRQAQRIMDDWNYDAHEGEAEYTASEVVRIPMKARGDACRTNYYIGSIPLRVASTASAPLLTGDIWTLSAWLETPYIDQGYSTDESWECGCGESYHADDHGYTTDEY
jgi:hypothetical protein